MWPPMRLRPKIPAQDITNSSPLYGRCRSAGIVAEAGWPLPLIGGHNIRRHEIAEMPGPCINYPIDGSV